MHRRSVASWATLTSWSILFSMTALGCAGMASPDRYTQTGLRRDPKRPDCEYQLLTSVPARPFEELGIVDAYQSQTRDTAIFVSGMRSHVCAAGGDAAIAEKAGNGFYIKATVIKFTD